MLRAVAVAVALVSAGCAHGKQRDTFAVRFKAVPPIGHRVTTDDLERSISIMRQRLERLGISDAGVHRQGADVIVIEFPSRADARAAGDAIGKTALLEFYDFEPDLVGPSVTGGAFRAPVAKPSLFALLSDPATRALAKKGHPARWYRLRGRRLAVPANTVVVSCKAALANCLSTRPTTTKKVFYLMKEKPEMTGRDLNLAGIRADVDPNTGQSVILMQFTPRGRRVFRETTRREAERGALLCAGRRGQDAVLQCAQHFAIVVDHQLESAPYIDFVRNPDGIPGDNGVQLDLGSIREAKRLAIMLQTGALPVRFVRLP